MKKYLLFSALAFIAFGLKAQGLSAYEKKEFMRDDKILPYRILYPLNYDAKKKYPLIVFLHGSGERGYDNEKQLVHGGTFFLTDSIRKKFPAIVIFPQSPDGSTWAYMEAKYDNNGNTIGRIFPFQEQPTEPSALLKQLIDSVVATGTVNTKKIYIGGLSLGGMGVFDWVARYPNFFAAAFPICGAGNTDNAKRFAGKIALWIFHGSADQSVNPDFSRKYYKALKQLHADVRYTEYPGIGHNSWDNAFAEKDLLPWLFSKMKK